MNEKILIVEDNPVLAEFYADCLSKEGFVAEYVKNSDDFFMKCRQDKYDLFILDIKLNNSKLSGLEILKKVKNDHCPDTEIIIISGQASRTQVAEAIKLGALNFIEKEEFTDEKFIADVKQAIRLIQSKNELKITRAENLNLKSVLLDKWKIIGESEPMMQLQKKIAKYAGRDDLDVVVYGETGTGKELVARNLHLLSARSNSMIFMVNAGGLKNELAESILFGHKKGSFTGAVENKKGYFERAENGILVLDEISSLSMDLQLKLLRVIEYKEFEVLGGEIKKTNARLIFLTNQPLEKLLKEGKIREDFYYRLEKAQITVPPLRDRYDDLIILFNHFMGIESQKEDLLLNYSLEEMKNILMKHNWTGNVRELKNFCMNLSLNHTTITAKIVEQEVKSKTPYTEDSDAIFYELPTFKEAVREFEKSYIRHHLKRNNQNISETARKIGIDRSTIYEKM